MDQDTAMDNLVDALVRLHRQSANAMYSLLTEAVPEDDFSTAMSSLDVAVAEYVVAKRAAIEAFHPEGVTQ